MVNYIQNFNLRFDYLRESKLSFDLYLSKNSIKIITSEGEKYFYAKNKLNPKVFHISNQIKKESDLYFEENPERKETDRAKIKYYNYNDKNLIPTKRFYYIDLSSCYLTVLYNCKLISKELFLKINSLPKKDRLISLGMLAYEPYLISYIEGEKGMIKKIKNEYSKTFYLACALTQEIMDHVIKIIDNKYMFYWVDGIFFEDYSIYNKVCDYLKSIKMNFRFGSCFDLRVRKEKNYYNLNFLQADKGKLDIKRYNIPVYFHDHNLKRENYELILKGDISGLVNNFYDQQKFNNSNH